MDAHRRGAPMPVSFIRRTAPATRNFRRAHAAYQIAYMTPCSCWLPEEAAAAPAVRARRAATSDVRRRHVFMTLDDNASRSKRARWTLSLFLSFLIERRSPPFSDAAMPMPMLSVSRPPIHKIPSTSTSRAQRPKMPVEPPTPKSDDRFLPTSRRRRASAHGKGAHSASDAGHGLPRSHTPRGRRAFRDVISAAHGGAQEMPRDDVELPSRFRRAGAKRTPKIWFELTQRRHFLHDLRHRGLRVRPTTSRRAGAAIAARLPLEGPVTGALHRFSLPSIR